MWSPAGRGCPRGADRDLRVDSLTSHWRRVGDLHGSSSPRSFGILLTQHGHIFGRIPEPIGSALTRQQINSDGTETGSSDPTDHVSNVGNETTILVNHKDATRRFIPVWPSVIAGQRSTISTGHCHRVRW